MESKTFIQLGAMIVFAISVAINFKKRKNALLDSCLLCILGWLMMIYSKL